MKVVHDGRNFDKALFRFSLMLIREWAKTLVLSKLFLVLFSMILIMVVPLYSEHHWFSKNVTRYRAVSAIKR